VKPLLFAGVLALATVGCGSSSKPEAQIATATNPTGTAAVTTHGRFHYSDTVVGNCMRSCLKNSSVTRAYCACTLDKLSNSVSTGDFARIGLSGGHIPPRVRRLIGRAAVACRDKL
jgi:hypothetical protein